MGYMGMLLGRFNGEPPQKTRATVLGRVPLSLSVAVASVVWQVTAGPSEKKNLLIL